MWHSEEAEKVRKSIKDGSYSYCRRVSCPFLENDSLPDLSAEEFEKAARLSDAPIEFNLAHDYICNHTCPSCRSEVFIPDEKYIQDLNTTAKKLIPYLNKAKLINICGSGDVFSSKYMMELLSYIHPENDDILMSYETNGVLFDEEHWNKLSHLHRFNTKVTVTPNSFERNTYKYLCGGHDNLDKLLKNLEYIKSLREKKIVNQFDISIVVQERNFREFPSFIKKCIEDFNVDSVVVKPIYKWFKLTEEEYWFKDILNPLHPYHKEYFEILNEPICKDSRVYYWGSNNIHECAEHPSKRFVYMFYALATLINEENINEKLNKIVKKHGYNNIAIYGVADLGIALYKVLKDSKINVKYFVDKYSGIKKLYDLDVVNLFDFDSNSVDTIMVTSINYFNTIQAELRKLGFNGEIISIKDITDKIKCTE